MHVAALTLDPAFRVGAVDPPDLRHLRRAHGSLGLHRHLRARPPDRGPGRVPRVTCSSWSASSAPPWCATRAATSSPATAGRTASARSPSGPRRLDLAWRTVETNEVGVDEFTAWCAPGRARPDDGGEPRHPRGPGGRRPAGVLQPPGGHRAVRPAPVPRRQGAARHPHLVPRQRARRALAGGPQDRRTSTAGWPPRRPVRCGWSTRGSSWWRAAAPTARCRRSVVGGHRAGAVLRPRRLRLAAHLLRPARSPTARASWPARSTSSR